MTADARNYHPLRLAVLSAAMLFVAALAPSPSRGATMTTVAQTATIPVTPTDWSPGTPATVTNPLSFTKFDSSLGTLLSVNFALNYTLQNTFNLTFTAPATLTAGMTNTSITVDRPDGTSIIAALPADVTQSDTVSSGFPTTKTFTPPAITGSATSLSLTNATDLALFSANNTNTLIGLPVIANAHSTFSSSTGNGSGGVTTDAGATVIVTYTYAPVPEPSTVAILGLGLAAALVVRRKRA